MSFLDVLAEVVAKVLLHDGGAVEGDMVWPFLNAVEFVGEHGKGVIL